MKLSLFFVGVLLVAMFSLESCKSNETVGIQPLVVERQECFLKNYTHLTEVLPLTIDIDLPVEGPQLLVDSVTTFLNEALYEFFDNGEECHLPYDSVFSKDVKRLAEHYRDAYKPFFLADGVNEHEFGADCLELNLVAQTDTYVTYEVDNVFFGEGVETSTEWVTFVKNDGHRLGEVISEDGLLRFYREHPNLRSEDVWSNVQFHLSDSSGVGLVCEVGLLNDSVAHQYVYATGIFEDLKYPLDSIAPYLSKEARELIGGK
ncbi:MAG: hypothetical protein IKW98_05780 [Prevotella sp.]|nr:hypothetical protein [Prevotella sp.]